MSHGLLVTTVNSLQARPEFTGTDEDLGFIPGCYKAPSKRLGQMLQRGKKKSYIASIHHICVTLEVSSVLMIMHVTPSMPSNTSYYTPLVLLGI